MFSKIWIALLFCLILIIPANAQMPTGKTDITGYYTLDLRGAGDSFDTAVFEEVDFGQLSGNVSDVLPILMPTDAWSEYDPPVQVFSNNKNVDRTMGAPDINIFVRDGVIVAIDTTYGFVPAGEEATAADESGDSSEGMDLNELKNMVIGIVVDSYDASLRVDPLESITGVSEIHDMFRDADSDVLVIYENLGTHVTYMTGDFYNEFLKAEEAAPARIAS